MGHKSIQMTIDLYTELGLKDLAEEVRAAPQFFLDGQLPLPAPDAYPRPSEWSLQ